MSTAAVHYPDLLDPRHAQSFLAADATPDLSAYEANRGFRHSSCAAGEELLEVVALQRDVVLILYRARNQRAQQMWQAITPGHWLHMQFCVSGSGRESLGSPEETAQTPAGMSTVTSYSDRALIRRDLDASRERMTACLYLRGRMLERFFRVSNQSIPHMHQWIVGSGAEGVQHLSLPIHPRGFCAVRDMMTCEFRASARLSYMQAKSAELIATLLHGLNTAAALCDQVSLAPVEIDRLQSTKRAIEADHGVVDSLPELAARAGLSRSRLAAGFKKLFGVPVQTFARDVRLAHALELLSVEKLPVSVVAEQVGYAEVSSFTRAFTARFGVSPKSVRRPRES